MSKLSWQMIKEVLKKADSFLTDVVYPKQVTCLNCGRPCIGHDLCVECEAGMDAAKLPEAVCPKCGYPLENGTCDFCAEYRTDADRMLSVWRHTGVPRKLVHSLKYNAVAPCAEVLARGIAEKARELPLDERTVVTWAAMPPKRLRERGIDHARELAEQTAVILALPCRQLLLRDDRRDDQTQQGLNAQQRMQNLQDCYHTAEILHGESVLLIDDVTTTGSTGSACVRTLKEGGSGPVWVVTATRAMTHNMDR